MKRFSKIFCVALVAIILSGLNQHWQLINSAAAASDKVMQLCETSDTGSTSTIKIADLPVGATVKDYEGSCYSKAIDFIFSFYNKYNVLIDQKYITPNPKDIIFSGPIKSVDGSLSFPNPAGMSTPWQEAFTAYQSNLKNAIPDNASFDSNNVNIAAINTAIGATESPIIIGDPDTPLIPSVQNDGICDNIGFNLLIPSTWLPTFNCWIVSLISKVIEWGVKLMSLFIEPSFWGGISTNPAVAAGFGASVKLVNIVFSVVLAVMAIGTILNLKSYKINDLITKFIIVALLINFTLVIAGSIIDLANYLSLYFLNLTAHSANGSIVSAWMGIFSGVANYSSAASTTGVLLITLLINILLLVAMTWAFGSIIFSLLKRGFMLIVLLILSPFAVITYLLPGKGMGQWWGKWKAAFLKYTFYGVYVTAGIYLGTIMLQSLCINLNTDSLAANSEMSFMSGLIVPIMAAGFLIFIVLLADELAGGSAKAAAEGASKLALGLAGGAALAGATGIVTKIGTSKQVGDLAKSLSEKGGLSAALGTRLSSFNKTSQGKAQESRKAVEVKLANENPEAYKGKVDNLLQRFGKGETLNARDQQFLAAALKTLPDKQRKALSDDAHKAIPSFTDSMFKAGVLSKPEQKDINATVPIKAARLKAETEYNKADAALKTETDPDKIIKLEKDKKAAISDNVGDIVTTIKRYNAFNDKDRKDDFAHSLADVNDCLSQTGGAGGDLKEAIYNGLLVNNTTGGVWNMLEEIQKADLTTPDEMKARADFFDNIINRLVEDYGKPDRKNFVKEMAAKPKKGAAKAIGVYQRLLAELRTKYPGFTP